MNLLKKPDVPTMVQRVSIKHRQIQIDGLDVFFREAGPEDAPVLLLPHGYPCSSYQFRNLIPLLGDRWHVIAPDFPAFGYSGTPAPQKFDYSFDGYAKFLDRFVRSLGVRRYALYLQDYGSQVGLRLAIKAPERVLALIIQNGDIYEDTLGPKYESLKAYWAKPSAEGREKLLNAVTEEGFRDEFIGEIEQHLIQSIPPDMWKLSWSQMTAARREVMVGLMEGLQANLQWFPRYQAYLRNHQPDTLIVWGPQDGYMPEAAAQAYLRDLPDAELHVLNGGHWLLETHLDEVASLIRDFLIRKVPAISVQPARHDFSNTPFLLGDSNF